MGHRRVLDAAGLDRRRKARDISRGKQDGRGVEIQRLIGRSLRGVVDVAALGERSVYVDCDVLEADGGTRCASITGGFVALQLALADLVEAGTIEPMPLNQSVAAISVGMVAAAALCDLDYAEDSTAEVDANVVMTGDGGLVEVQATAERTPLSRALAGRAAVVRRGRDRGPSRGAGRGGRRPPGSLSPSWPMAALIVSTRNEHKLRGQLREALPGVDLAPLPEAVELPPEDGESFEENALIKARAARTATGGAALADDSGIEAAALGGRPGVFSARYAGEHASDEENLAKLLEEVGRGSDRRVTYVCALAYIDPDGEERQCSRAAARESSWRRRTEAAGSGTTRRSSRPTPARGQGDDGRAERGREHAISHRAQGLAHARRTSGGRVRITSPPPPALSIASNCLLIALKLAAAAITGSIAILSEALHSSIDLIASVIALSPSGARTCRPTPSTRTGTRRWSIVAASHEGMLISSTPGSSPSRRCVGSRRAVARIGPRHRDRGDRLLGPDEVGVATFLRRQSRVHQSPALAGDAAHLGADAATSLAVLAGLAFVEATGVVEIDSIVAIMVAGAIVYAGINLMRRSTGVLVDEAPPPAEMDRIEMLIAAARPEEMVGYHKLRGRVVGEAPLHRDARAVPYRHDARARSHPRPHAARRDRVRRAGR